MKRAQAVNVLSIQICSFSQKKGGHNNIRRNCTSIPFKLGQMVMNLQRK